MIKTITKLPGILATLIVGLAAFSLSKLHPAMDFLVLGLLLGLLLRTLFTKMIKTQLADSITGASKSCITIGIIFYGANLKLQALGSIPLTTWLQILIGIFVLFWVALSIGDKLNLSRSLVYLLSIGTAICGASAIAIATPIVKGKAEEAGAALIAITIWGLLGLAIYPWLPELLMMTSESYALLCATTLHQTGMVKAAAAHLGDSCLQSAMLIKVARTAMIIPILVAILAMKSRGEDQNRNVCLQIPWYLWAFLACSVLFSYIPFLQERVNTLKPIGEFLWTMAMSGIGLSVDARSAMKGMGRALFLTLILWLILIFNFFIGYYGLNY